MLDRKRFGSQHAVFFHRNHHPSRNMRRLGRLLLGSGWRSPPNRSGYKAGDKGSQNKLSEFGNHSEN